MSFFGWFRSKPQPASALLNSSLTRAEETRPLARTPPAAPNPLHEQKKNARYMRRELLYAIIRESMIRFGVLSGGYKFKALALDPRGLQFMVMIDLALEFGGQSERLSEIEALVAQSAKTRHGIVVTAVYWRLNEHVALGKPPEPVAAAVPAVTPTPMIPNMVGAAAAVGVASAAAAAASAPQAQWQTPRDASASKPMPLFPLEPIDPDQDPLMAPRDTGNARYEPIDNDEVEAFRRALSAGASAGPLPAPILPSLRATIPEPVAPPAQAARPPQPLAQPSYALLTGFEDTEAVDPDFAPPALGTTQYGELR